MKIIASVLALLASSPCATIAETSQVTRVTGEEEFSFRRISSGLLMQGRRFLQSFVGDGVRPVLRRKIKSN